VELGGPGVPKPHQRFTGDAFELLIWLALPASRRAVAAKMPSNGCGGAVRLHCAYPFSCSCGASQNPCGAIFLSNFTLLHCCRAVRLPYSFRIPTLVCHVFANAYAMCLEDSVFPPAAAAASTTPSTTRRGTGPATMGNVCKVRVAQGDWQALRCGKGNTAAAGLRETTRDIDVPFRK